MISVPLFGKDSIPHRTSNILGLIGTIVIWFIFILCMVFIPVRKKQSLKPVQIVLDTTPTEKKFIPQEKASSSPNASENEFTEVVEKTVAETPVEQPTIEQIVEPVQQTMPEPIVEPVPEPVKPVIEKTVPQAKPVEEKVKPVEKKVEPVKKPEPVQKIEETPALAKAETVFEKDAASSFEEIQLSKSVEELMSEQMNTKTTPKKAFDWSMFDDDAPVEENVPSSTPKKVLEESKIEGSSGNVVQNKTDVKASTTKTSNETVEKKASSKTSQNLANIQNVTTYKSTSGGSEGTVKASTIKDGSGKTKMTMASGSARSLLDPAEPKVTLSPENGAKINSDVTVEIRFSVLSGGNTTEIIITPESLLPESVRNEIKNQIAKWRFEASDSIDDAKFEYTIKKK